MIAANYTTTMKARSFTILLLIVLFLLVHSPWMSERTVGNLSTSTTNVHQHVAHSDKGVDAETKESPSSKHSSSSIGSNEEHGNDDDDNNNNNNKTHMDSPHQDSSSSSFPPLSSLIQNEQIIGDVQFLLDFAIIGHSKTGTTGQLKWLRAHEQVLMDKKEQRFLKNGQPSKLVELLYSLPQNSTRYLYKRGYKSPSDVIHPISLQALHQYWPQTKLIVGIRHPVLWFQSYYNFHVRMQRHPPPAHTMVGELMPEMVFFHQHLALLGKTMSKSSTADDQQRQQYELLGWNDTVVAPTRMTNRIFLYDSGQPFDKNVTRRDLYAKDVTNFIGLESPLQPMVPRQAPGPNYDFGIHICDDDFIPLRGELMEVARNASAWIRTYFCDHPDVMISSREYFKTNILASWLVDPCDADDDDNDNNKDDQDEDEDDLIFGADEDENESAAFTAAPNSEDDDDEFDKSLNVDNIITIEKPDPFPPLSTLISPDTGEIIGDVQFLLDFAIIGHSKTGTTGQLKWLRAHEQVQMEEGESYFLKNGMPQELIEMLYNNFPHDAHFKRGYKSPSDILRPVSLQAIRTYWPQTKLIVGIRHPVKWFESFHNYNERRGRNPAPAETIIGSNMPEMVRFHKHLALLGKTIASGLSSFDKEQYELLGWNETFASWPPSKTTNPIFLYDSGQPFDVNNTRAEQYSQDMTTFLGLDNPPLEAMVAHDESDRPNYHFGMDICEDTFIELRAELMEVARNASTWIKDYFMVHPDVTVSSPGHFKNEILASWNKDPCDDDDA